MSEITQKTIEAPIHRLAWPKACCRCGSSSYGIRKHTENVVSWTVISVTAYRNISLPIPVCNSCFYRRYFWYAAAVALAALVLVVGKFFESSEFGGIVMGSAMFLAIGLGFVGTRRQPLNMLSFNTNGNLLTLRVYNEVTAKALLSAEEAKEVVFHAVRRRYLWALAGTLLVVGAAIVANQVIR